RVLAHRPGLLAVHAAMDPARVGKLTGLAKIQLLGQVRLAVALGDLDPGVREPTRVIRPHDRCHGQALGALAARLGAALGGCHELDDKDRPRMRRSSSGARSIRCSRPLTSRWRRAPLARPGRRRGYSAPVSTCLVTGGAGFLGSHLCDELLARGHRVICVDNLETGSLANIEHIGDPERFVHLGLDIIEPYVVEEPVDFVYHLASPASPIDYLRLPLHTLKVGSYGTHHTLGLAKAKRARSRRSCARRWPTVRSRCSETAARRARSATSATRSAG